MLISASVEERGTRPIDDGTQSNYEIIIHLTADSRSTRDFSYGRRDRIYCYSNVLQPGQVTVDTQVTCLNAANFMATAINGQTIAEV